SYSATLLVQSNLNLIAIGKCFPSGDTNIAPIPLSDKLTAPSKYISQTSAGSSSLQSTSLICSLGNSKSRAS
ncbi:hypothetical protein P3X46_013910, partial [Hevea brasiliensis]